MINFNDVTQENIEGHNPNWHQIPGILYRILVTEGSRSRRQYIA